MSQESMELRVRRLEQQMEATDETVTGLQSALIGTTEKPGALELIRNLQGTMDDFTSCMEKLTKAVDGLTHDRSKMVGIWIGAGMIGGIIGFLFRYVLSQ